MMSGNYPAGPWLSQGPGTGIRTTGSKKGSVDAMTAYKTEFIHFMVRSGVLTFGEFTLKSGRKAPYFVNTGNYTTGEQLSKLGGFYADCIRENLGDAFDLLYGPAYKGIPLAVAAASSLYAKYGINKEYAFNRKEAKDHGEGGVLVGHKPADGERVLIVEDVITAGTAMRENLPILEAAAKVKIAGVVISVDRKERGQGERSAVQEIEATYGFPVFPIVTIDEIIEALHNVPVDGRVYIDDAMRAKMDAYRKEYGV